MDAAIVGMGTWLPDQIRTNSEWPESFGQRQHQSGERTFNDIAPSEDSVAEAILSRDLQAESNDLFLGATRRRVAPENMTAAEAEALAARVALADAGLSGAEVDLVLTHAVVPDRIGPPSAAAVAHLVGANRAMALAVDAACASTLAQLEIARAYIEAGLAKVVLIAQSHLMIRAFPMSHPASPGLGDGATALVVARGHGLSVRSTFGVTHGEHSLSVTWIRGIDDPSDPPWWKTGADFRLGSRLPEGAKFLMRETVSYGAATVREAAERASVDVERIGVLASVQPRGFIPHAIAERLGLPRACAVTTYEEIAHVGVCGPVFNLVAAKEQGRLRQGTIVALYGQGAGFTRAAAMLEVTALADRAADPPWKN